MQKKLQAEIKRTIRENQQHKAWVRVVSILAGIVVFCTTYALILPAITFEDLPDEVGELIERIDAFPTPEEIGEALTALDEAGDEDGYAEYYSELQRSVWSAWLMYEEFGLGQGYDIPNKDRLLALDWMLTESLVIPATEDTVTVHAMNQVNWDGYTCLVYCNGKTLKDLTESEWGFWKAYVVEKDLATGSLKIVEVIDKDIDTDTEKVPYNKGYLKTTTSDGFILLVHADGPGENARTIFQAKEGDYLTVNFNYKTTSRGFNQNGYGTVSITTPPKVNDLEPIPNKVSTKDFIKLDLYDYGDKINLCNNSNPEYPSFTQSGGETLENGAISYNNEWKGFQFGENITNEYYGITGSGTGAINASTDQGWENSDEANQIVPGTNQTQLNYLKNRNGDYPLSGALSPVLSADGYPEIKAGGLSLEYLFSDTEEYSVSKQNTENIDGLFQYDEDTGKYYYYSRKNHAQFNAETNTFDLYQEIYTPNFIMYPFGNFAPFENINDSGKQVSTVNREYFETMQANALAKSQSASEPDTIKMYQNLADVLKQFIDDVDNGRSILTKGGWTATDLIKDYFRAAENRAYGAQYESVLTPEFLDNLYSKNYDVSSNFFFGMTMEMVFMQAKNGKVGKNNQEDMIFRFVGDDDVMVYIDGVLFLDLSGKHRHVGGEIDFVKGEIRCYAHWRPTYDIEEKPFKTVTFAEILSAAGRDTSDLNAKGTFKDYSTHALNFYYMERGSGSGVCEIEFNFPLLKQNTVSVMKELEVKEEDQGKINLLGNPDFMFQLLMVDGSGNKTNKSLVEEGASYTIYDRDNKEVGKGTVRANGVFSLKAGQRAEFDIKENDDLSGYTYYFARELLDANMFEQFGEVRANGSVVSADRTETIIDSNTFFGVDSVVKKLEDGLKTQFTYVNQVDFNKLGALKITKELEALSPVLPDQTFDFTVTLDGVPISIGTKYRMTEADGTETVLSIESPGSLSLPPGATATFSGLIAGTRFELQETSESAEGYTVAYAGDDDLTTDGTSAAGVILAKTEDGSTDGIVRVTAMNSEQGTSLELPVYKTLANPDGAEHTYQFKLEEIMSSEDPTLKENGLVQQLEITVINSADGIFTLPYPVSDYLNPETKLYYKITELSDADDRSTTFDQGVYIAEVTVTRIGGELSASLTGLWKEGTASESISFTNVLLKKLTLNKVIAGVTPSGQEEFAFEIELKDQNGIPVNGALTAVRTEGGKAAREEFIQFTDGKAEIRLTVLQTVTVYGIPNGAAWTVRELTTDGYRVNWEIDGMTSAQSNTASGTLDGSVVIKCINTTSYELPATGGSGTISYITGGLLLWLCAGILLYIKYKRGRRSTVPPDL